MAALDTSTSFAYLIMLIAFIEFGAYRSSGNSSGILNTDLPETLLFFSKVELYEVGDC